MPDNKRKEPISNNAQNTSGAQNTNSAQNEHKNEPEKSSNAKKVRRSKVKDNYIVLDDSSSLEKIRRALIKNYPATYTERYPSLWLSRTNPNNLASSNKIRAGFHYLVRGDSEESANRMISSVLEYYLRENKVIELKDFLFGEKVDYEHLQTYVAVIQPVLCNVIMQERTEFANILVQKLVSILKKKKKWDTPDGLYIKRMLVVYLFRNIVPSAKNLKAIYDLMNKNGIIISDRA